MPSAGHEDASEPRGSARTTISYRNSAPDPDQNELKARAYQITPATHPCQSSRGAVPQLSTSVPGRQKARLCRQWMILRERERTPSDLPFHIRALRARCGPCLIDDEQCPLTGDPYRSADKPWLPTDRLWLLTDELPHVSDFTHSLCVLAGRLDWSRHSRCPTFSLEERAFPILCFVQPTAIPSCARRYFRREASPAMVERLFASFFSSPVKNRDTTLFRHYANHILGTYLLQAKRRII